MKGLSLILIASIFSVCFALATPADGQIFGNRTTVRVNSNDSGFRNNITVRSRGSNNPAIAVNAGNGFNGANILVANNNRHRNNANANIFIASNNNRHRNNANIFVANNHGFGANVLVANGHGFAGSSRFNTFGTRTVVTPAGIYEVDAFGNAFLRAPQASFVPATAFGTGFGGFNSVQVQGGFCR